MAADEDSLSIIETWLQQESPRRFEAWIDAIAVCRSYLRWDLAEACGHRALESALQRSLNPVQLRDAARAVVAGAAPRLTAGPDWFTSARDGYRLAREGVAERRARAVHASVRQLLDEVLRDLDKMLLLVVSDEPASRTQLAGLVRAYDRADLAQDLAARVLVAEPDDPVALTILGASKLDQGDLSGIDDARKALKLGGGSHAHAVLARGLRLIGDAASVETALALMRSHPSVGTAKLLAAAAVAAGDHEALQEAQECLARLEGGPEAKSQSDRQIRLLAAEQLMRDKDWAQAETLLRELMNEKPWHKPAEMLGELFRRRRAATREADLS